MTEILKDALKIRELKFKLQTIATDDGKSINDYSAAEIIGEAKHCIWDLEELTFEDVFTDKQMRTHKSQIMKLKKFVDKYSKVI